MGSDVKAGQISKNNQQIIIVFENRDFFEKYNVSYKIKYLPEC